MNQIDMYHVCMTAHSEVLMRNADDERELINLIALAAARTNTRILVDALMSNHIHLFLTKS